MDKRREDTWWKEHEDATVGEYDVRARRDGILHIISDSYGALTKEQAWTIAEALNESAWRCINCRHIFAITDVVVDEDCFEYCPFCEEALPAEPIGSYEWEMEGEEARPQIPERKLSMKELLERRVDLPDPADEAEPQPITPNLNAPKDFHDLIEQDNGPFPD